MKKHRIAVVPGDGIGNEVVPESLKVLEVLAEKFGYQFSFMNYDYSCEHYAKTGMMMPKDGLDRLRDSDSIFLGAVGYPGVPDHVSLWGLLIPIRREFDQYINLRPVRLLKGLESPLKHVSNVDYMIVRENTEGEYSSIGGKANEGQENEYVTQEAVFTKKGVDRVMKYAFELAQKRNNRLTSATKSNGIIHTMTYWDDRFNEISKDYTQVETSQYHIDILCAHFVQHPDWFDVVVASNLFGDILSDLGPAVVGGIGIAAGGNINPEKQYPSMFEPVHGSAPDIAGQNIANPIACFWTAAMMLDHLNEQESALLLMDAIEFLTSKSKVLTKDLGGRASTTEVTNELIRIIKNWN